MAPEHLFILAGDIGGTNSRLALHNLPASENDESYKTPVFTKTYGNESYVLDHGSEAFHVILNTFFGEFIESDATTLSKAQFEAGPKSDVAIVACFACAGPILHNACTFTNIEFKKEGYSKADKFVIDGNIISATSSHLLNAIVHCRVVNDFVGQGYGSLDLDVSTEAVPLVPDSDKLIDKLGPKVCVGAGTGLGQCFLTISNRDPSLGYECFPSEGGHVEFAPRSDLEIELLQYLKKKFSQNHRVSVERCVSGKGLANIYEFLAQKFPDRVDKKVHDEFLAAGDMQGRVVGTNATEGSLCEQAILISVSAYGSECGSAALKFIPTGGLYVTGGLTPKLLKYIQPSDSPFMKAYHDKGRVTPLLDSVPLFAVKSEDLGLRGARVCAAAEMNLWLTKQGLSPSAGKKSEEKVKDKSMWSNSLMTLLHVAAAVGVVALIGMQKKK